MNSIRRTSIIVGLFFIVGTVAGVMSSIFTGSITTDQYFPMNIAENETRWILGTLLILVMGFPLAMIPALLFPIFRKRYEVLAMGAVVFRGVLEAVCYIIIVLGQFLLLAVSQFSANNGNTSMIDVQLVTSLLNETGKWTNLILAIVFSIGSIMISWMFYKTKYIPRWLSIWGLVGGILYFFAPFVCMLGAQHLPFSLSGPIGFLIGPLALQEMVFAIWVIIKGFNTQVKTVESY